MFIGHYLSVSIVLVGIVLIFILCDSFHKKRKIKKRYQRLQSIEKEFLLQLKRLDISCQPSEVTPHETRN